MAKAIYSINVFLFHQHFSLTVNVKFSLKELALCVSLGYVRFWHQAPLPIQAPLNDKKLTKYQNIAVAQAVSTTFRRQLWYFFEILVGLSFFMKEFAADVKTHMVANIQLPQSAKCLKQINHHSQPLSSLGLRILHQTVNYCHI